MAKEGEGEREAEKKEPLLDEWDEILDDKFFEEFEFPAPPDAASDDKALKESVQFQEGLDNDAARREHSRSQGVKNIAYCGLVACISIFAFATAWGIAALAWHTLMPEDWSYLSEKQLSQIKGFLGVVLVSGLLADYARKLLK